MAAPEHHHNITLASLTHHQRIAIARTTPLHQQHVAKSLPQHHRNITAHPPAHSTRGQHITGLQRHVWSTIDFSEIGLELVCNDLQILWSKMGSERPPGRNMNQTIHFAFKYGMQSICFLMGAGFGNSVEASQPRGWVRAVRLKTQVIGTMA